MTTQSITQAPCAVTIQLPNYLDVLRRRIQAGRKMMDLLCHGEDLDSDRAIELHEQMRALDQALDRFLDEHYASDFEALVLPAEDARYHRPPGETPADHDQQPCDPCLFLAVDAVALPAPRSGRAA